MPQNPRAGFTLIELLVVIAIIAVIAAILFPVFAHARGKARQATCLSNQKQIAMGWWMYIQDYDETFPFVLNLGANDRNNGNLGDRGKWPAVTGVTGQEPRFQLVTLVIPYVKNQSVWYCPSVGPNGTCEPCLNWGIWKKGATMQDQGTSYMYNYCPAPFPNVELRRILMGGKPYAILREPTRWPMLREYPSAIVEVNGNLIDPPVSAVPHAGGLNIAYGDGHVKFYRMEDAGGPGITRHSGDGLFEGQ